MEAIKPSNIRLKHAKKRLKAAFWIAIITLQVIHGQGKTYYISNSGDDLHSTTQAQSPETPWKSLKKTSTYEFKPGDSILFRSGDDFFGNLLITESGTAEEPIVFSKYGDGEKHSFGLKLRSGTQLLLFLKA